MRRFGVLLAVILVLVACSSDPPAEDVARAEVLKTDPIFEVDTGLRESLGVFVVHGTGAMFESEVLEVGRAWYMDNAEPVAMAELLLAAAIDAGWKHLTVECPPGGTIRFSGAKNFNDEEDFRAALAVTAPTKMPAGAIESRLRITIFTRRPSLERVSGLVAPDAPVVEDRSCLDDPAAGPPPGLVTTTTLQLN